MIPVGRDLNKSLLKRKEVQEESLETDLEYNDEEEGEDVNNDLVEEHLSCPSRFLDWRVCQWSSVDH